MNLDGIHLAGDIDLVRSGGDPVVANALGIFQVAHTDGAPQYMGVGAVGVFTDQDAVAIDGFVVIGQRFGVFDGKHHQLAFQ